MYMDMHLPICIPSFTFSWYDYTHRKIQILGGRTEGSPQEQIYHKDEEIEQFAVVSEGSILGAAWPLNSPYSGPQDGICGFQLKAKLLNARALQPN